MYRRGSVLLLSNESFELGEVEAVCLRDDRLCFLIVLLHSAFDLHINAYEVWRSEEWAIVEPGDLRDFKPLRRIQLDERTFVVEEYHA